MKASETILKLRVALHLDKSEFGHKIGMSYSAINHYEKGTRHPRMSSIRRILALAKEHKIKINIEDLLS